MRKIAEAIRGLGAETAIVKLGAKGAYYSGGNENGYAEGYQIQTAADPVGAGDALQPAYYRV